MSKKLTPIQIAWLMVGINLVWRFVWFIWADGSYTDGVLQITAFENGLTFWPPLYTALSYAFIWVPGLDHEGSARLVSTLAASFAVLPIELIARRMFGSRASLLAAFLYTFSPLPLRWGAAVMTDATFMALWMASLASLVMAARLIWPELYEQTRKKSKADANQSNIWMLLASLAGVCATLTRYQGALLLPVILVILWRSLRTKEKLEEGEADAKPSFPPWVTLAPWAIVAIYGFLAYRGGQVGDQGDQFLERMSTSVQASAINYWYLFEMFLLSTPYFLTYGIFGFAIYGLARIKFSTRRISATVTVGLLLTLALLILHSVFQAFQTRYLLPIVPFFCIVAGHGMAVWERANSKKYNRFLVLAGLTIGYAVVFSSLVGVFQTRPFYDMKQAGEWLKENAPEGAVITSNERFKFTPDIAAAKLEFWAGRPVKGYHRQWLNPGDFIVLSSFYGRIGFDATQHYGGKYEYSIFLNELMTGDYNESLAEAGKLYDVEKAVAPFTYTSYPLLPDIMEETIAHTNPLAFYMRYRPQTHETTILKVKPFNDSEFQGLAPDAAPAPAAEADAEPAAEPVAEPVAEEAPAADAPEAEASNP